MILGQVIQADFPQHKNTAKDNPREQNVKKNYTQLPNWIGDTPMPAIERSMLTLIARASAGYHREIAYISIAEFMELEQASKNTVLKAQRSLIQKGWIIVAKTNGGRSSKTAYSITKNPPKNGSKFEPFKPLNGSKSEPLTNTETVQNLNPNGSKSEPFKPLNGSKFEPAIKKESIKESIKENIGPGFDEKAGECEEQKNTENQPNSATRFVYKKSVSIPANFEITPQVQQWAESKGHENLDEHLESFILQANAKGYTYKNWNAAFQNAVRKDWAGLNKKTKTNRHESRETPDLIGDMLSNDFDREQLERAMRKGQQRREESKL